MTTTPVIADTPDGHWAGYAEAASTLGISPSTLQRRIASGQLITKKDHGRSLVWIGEDGQPTRTIVTTVAKGQSDSRASQDVEVTENDPDFHDSREYLGSQSANGAVSPDTPDTQTVSALTATLGQAISALERALDTERQRVDEAQEYARQVERQLHQVEQAAAMHQERSRLYEEELGRLREQLALPSPALTVTERRSPWWMFWAKTTR